MIRNPQIDGFQTRVEIPTQKTLELAPHHIKENFTNVPRTKGFTVCAWDHALGKTQYRSGGKPRPAKLASRTQATRPYFPKPVPAPSLSSPLPSLTSFLAPHAPVPLPTLVALHNIRGGFWSLVWRGTGIGSWGSKRESVVQVRRAWICWRWRWGVVGGGFWCNVTRGLRLGEPGTAAAALWAGREEVGF